MNKKHSERLYYSTGELLGADDLSDEQTYHRRQLARALLHLYGSGTLAGLKVACHHKPGGNGSEDEVVLKVYPGLALDHIGRLVEVPREACLRLRRWYGYIAQRPLDSKEWDIGDLRAAWRPNNAADPAAGGTVIADVFLEFYECNRGYTPAFASGPFDALDASQPSRIRDAYRLSLILRKEADNSLPKAKDPWQAETIAAIADPADRLAEAMKIMLDAWHSQRQPAPENPLDVVEETAILLARLRIPARQNQNVARAPVPDWSAAAWPDAGANLDNSVRRFIFPSSIANLLTT